MGQPVPERAAAKLAGERHYFTGIPCRNGHIAKRYTSSGMCFICDAERHARWHAVHPGIGAEWAKTLRAKDPTGHREAVKRWAQKNPDKTLASKQRWMERHPELSRQRAIAYVSAYRSRREANGGSFTPEDILELHRKQHGRCASCHKKLVRYEVDHTLPVILGGSSNPANLQLLCIPCNRSKGGLDPMLWAKRNGRLL